jgi:hypothetical protein
MAIQFTFIDKGLALAALNHQLKMPELEKIPRSESKMVADINPPVSFDRVKDRQAIALLNCYSHGARIKIWSSATLGVGVVEGWPTLRFWNAKRHNRAPAKETSNGPMPCRNLAKACGRHGARSFASTTANVRYYTVYHSPLTRPIGLRLVSKWATAVPLICELL